MPMFRVIYRCPICGNEDFLEAEYRSWSSAMDSASAPCPNHEEAGELQATKAVELKAEK